MSTESDRMKFVIADREKRGEHVSRLMRAIANDGCEAVATEIAYQRTAPCFQCGAATHRDKEGRRWCTRSPTCGPSITSGRECRQQPKETK